MKYFLLSAFSSGFLLLGISLVYWTTGMTNCAHLHELLLITDLQNKIQQAGIEDPKEYNVNDDIDKNTFLFSFNSS